MATPLYISLLAETPAAALVRSQLLPVGVGAPALVFGDRPEFDIFIADGVGNYDAASGSAAYTLKVGIGQFGQSILALQETWNVITNGWNAQIELNTIPLSTLIANQEFIWAFIEVQITQLSTGNIRTILQQPIEIRNEIVNPLSTVPVPLPSYYTAAESDARFVQNRSGVSGFTGGGATKLDGITTVGVAVGPVVAVNVGSFFYFFQLRAGTTAEDSPRIVRPDDYNASTNAKIWTLVHSNAVQRGTGNPNGVVIGEFDMQFYFDRSDASRWNWNTETSEWFTG